MTDPFHSLAISGSGMDVYQTWMDAIADNVANINNVTSTDTAAFQERYVVASSRTGQGGRPDGAAVTGVRYGNPLGRIVYDPQHPLADADGMVRLPDMNLSDQMTNMVIAQRAYQANVTAFRSARDAYQRALEIGR
ncbi:MAG: flagellar basal-body rod protein FlgC [Acidimicrobiia bacterium]|nr:flagellar basal-body rod protein FlgC [Acidimicrobiia bacterium]